MNSERWRQIEAIYQSAMDRAPEARDAHLAEACGADDELRREVESLLTLNSSPVVIDQPAWHAAAELLDNDSIVAAGTQLGPYRIEGALGAGAMGHVYRARDTRLDRLVAIKISKEEFSQRFEREARAVAALNHPNICSLYDVGPNYLVMELVEGPTLAERIRQGSIPLEESLAISRQIAGALEAAHECGIIHRDLKPGNIKIKADGTVKVLDFGLAKRAPASASAANPEDSPTISAATEVGVILGTAAYMSPEQARGHAVDKRTDIWAFGVVLFEMLTGRKLFAGATISDTLAAVITREPDWSDVSPRARRMLEACLEKDRKRRLRDIGDVWQLLDNAPPGTTPGWGKLPWILTCVLAVITSIALWAWRNTPGASEKPLVRLNVDLGSNMSLGTSGGPGRHAVLSADDSRLAFVSRSRIFTRRLDQSEAVELAGTDGAYAPFFSPDGRWIGFFTLARLKKISVDGGHASPLCDLGSVPAQGGDWSSDGKIVAAIGGVLSAVPSDGGTPVPLSKLAAGEDRHSLPQVLPDGKSVLFIVTTHSGSTSAEVLSLKDGRRKTVQPGAAFARYLSNGRLIYISRDKLYAIRFDLDALEVRGTPAEILTNMAPNLIEVSSSGTLIHSAHRATLTSRTVQWLESNGKMRPLLAKPDYYGRPRVSPDGERLALQFGVGPTSTLSIYELRRERLIPLAVRGAYTPVWSPDSRYIIFAASEGISSIPADGSGKPQLLMKSRNRQTPSSFTADGKRLAFAEANSATDAYDLWSVPVKVEDSGLTAGKPEVLLRTAFDERHPAFSPDGRWVAYCANDSGSFQVYVQPFSGSIATGARLRISSDGGVFPAWSRTRPELFFRTEDNRIMVVSYRTQNGSFVAEKPRRWAENRLAGGSAVLGNYDLGPDDRQVIALMPVENEEDTTDHHLTFLINFSDEVRRRTQ